MILMVLLLLDAGDFLQKDCISSRDDLVSWGLKQPMAAELDTLVNTRMMKQRKKVLKENRYNLVRENSDPP